MELVHACAHSDTWYIGFLRYTLNKNANRPPMKTPKTGFLASLWGSFCRCKSWKIQHTYDEPKVSHFVNFCGCLFNNYNCHNIYWDPLIWLVKNGHLIALTCISFFNEPGPYSWGAGPFTTELLLWYCAMLLWREMDSLQLLTLYLALTPLFSGRKAKINLHTTPKLTVVIPISCLLPCADQGIFIRGSNFFQGGGSDCLFPTETQITCDLPGGSGPPAPPPRLWIRTWLRSI